jgi:hypothetical protein
MSDNWIIVLAADPLATPSEERAEAALELLMALRPEGQEPELHLSETPEFFYAGSNFQYVFCPLCEREIGEWWSEAMNRWDKGGDRRSLAVETPCCSRATSLNDLDYVSPQGFACVALELMYPGADLEPEEVRQVEATLELPVRIVWKHI